MEHGPTTTRRRSSSPFRIRVTRSRAWLTVSEASSASGCWASSRSGGVSGWILSTRRSRVFIVVPLFVRPNLGHGKSCVDGAAWLHHQRSCHHQRGHGAQTKKQRPKPLLPSDRGRLPRSARAHVRNRPALSEGGPAIIPSSIGSASIGVPLHGSQYNR